MDKAKEKILKECRVVDTCFMSVSTIRGNFFSRHPININRVHRDTKYLLSLIIILETNVSGDEIFVME